MSTLGLLLLLLLATTATIRAQEEAPSTRYDHGIFRIDAQRPFLDLDDRALRQEQVVLDDRAAECGLVGGNLEWLVSPRAEAVLLADWPCPHLTWTELRTSGGRRAWLRVLRRHEEPVLEFIVEHGRARTGPPPRGILRSFVLGDDNGVTLHVRAEEGVRRIDVLVPSPESGLFEPIGVINEGTWTDVRPRVGSRRRYRLRAVFGDGRRAADQLVVGDTRSAGIISGSATMYARRQGTSGLDFRSGDNVRVAPDLTCIRIVGGRSAYFRDWTGSEVVIAPDPERETPWVPFAGEEQRRIPSETPFFVPLRGGGLARCRWRAIDGRRIELEYRVNPDGLEVLPRGRLHLSEDEKLLTLRLEAPGELQIVEAIAEDLTSTIGRRRSLDATDDPLVWTLPRPDESVCLEIHTTLATPEGWRAPPLRIRHDRRPAGVRSGRFQLVTQGEGFSFAAASPREGESADLRLKQLRSNRGFYSANLSGRARMATLFDVVRAIGDETLNPITQGKDLPPAGAVRMFTPTVGEYLRADARLESRVGSRRVLILRTQDGGWAVVRALKITARRGGRNPAPTTLAFDYLYNPREPVFGPFVEPLGTNEPLRFVDE